MQTDQHSGDVILRSSDKKLFHSWKILLSMSSPVFGTMFSLPQHDATGDVDDECPVIDLSEDSRTLDHVLSLCHPASCTGKHFKVETVRELGDILEATMKYDMDSIRSVVLNELTNPSFLHEDPVRIYAIACRHKCREAACLAAQHTLALPTLLHGYVPELEKVHAGQLCRLLLYREACVKAACPLAYDHTWINYQQSSRLFGCCTGKQTTIKRAPSRKYPQGREDYASVHVWWLEYMQKSGRALQKSPHSNTVKDQKLVNEALAAISSSDCQICKDFKVWEAFQCFVDIFAQEVGNRVAEVQIDLEF